MKYTIYHLVANQGGRYTKHIYIGGERIVSKIGDFASYDPDPRRIEYAGSEADAVTVDYDVKYSQQLQAIKNNYATFGVPYNGTDNDDYVNGEGFCCDDGSLEAAQAEAVAKANALDGNFQEGDAYEKLQFYYHADHLGSTSYITNLDGEVVQHVEYVPFGEVFIEERNNTWNTPYLFNANEFDEETGLYYYGARYYDPRLSLWISTDAMEEKYPNISAYCYAANNPILFTDTDGMRLWVANSIMFNLLKRTLAADDRQYLKLDKNGYVDCKLLNEGLSKSKTNSNNLKYLAYIVNDKRTVKLFDLAQKYNYKNAETGNVETKKFTAPERFNLYKDLMGKFEGDENLREKYSKLLIERGITDEISIIGNFGATLRPQSMQNEFPGGQISLSDNIEVYINGVGTTIMEQVKNIAHELFGHVLFGLKGLDPRHHGDNGLSLDRHIENVQNEADRNNK